MPERETDRREEPAPVPQRPTVLQAGAGNSVPIAYSDCTGCGKSARPVPESEPAARCDEFSTLLAPMGLVLLFEIFRIIPPLWDLTLPPDGVSFWSTPPIENLKTT